MKIYLVRHGNAVDKSVDPGRPLSEEGRSQIGKLSVLIAPHRWNVHIIFHSDKLRAVQTASILSSAFKSEKGVIQMNGLAPLDPVLPICERIYEINHDMVIVGHLPFLDHMVAFLLVGDETKDILSFPEGGMACLESSLNDKWRLQWFLNPNLAL